MRAQPSAELFQAASRSYGFIISEDCIDLGGSNTLNLLVTDVQSRYVVRVYRPYVTEARLSDIQLARQALNINGIPSSEVILTLNGQQWTKFNDLLVEVEKYVEKDANMNLYDKLMVGLPVLGQIHTILKGIQFSTAGRNPLFANYIEPQKALSLTLQGTKRIRDWKNLNNLRLVEAAEELAHLVFDGEQKFVPMLPRQVVHGDYWDTNVFFRDGRVVFVSDFEFMGERARIDDLALTLYFFDCSNEPVSEKRLSRLRNLIDRYDEGLSERLSIMERLALPLAIARQPLWSIGGWIALLDDEEAARRHADVMLDEVEFALRIVRELERWQVAFT